MSQTSEYNLEKVSEPLSGFLTAKDRGNLAMTSTQKLESSVPIEYLKIENCEETMVEFNNKTYDEKVDILKRISPDKIRKNEKYLSVWFDSFNIRWNRNYNGLVENQRLNPEYFIFNYLREQNDIPLGQDDQEQYYTFEDNALLSLYMASKGCYPSDNKKESHSRQLRDYNRDKQFKFKDTYDNLDTIQHNLSPFLSRQDRAKLAMTSSTKLSLGNMKEIKGCSKLVKDFLSLSLDEMKAKAMSSVPPYTIDRYESFQDRNLRVRNIASLLEAWFTKFDIVPYHHHPSKYMDLVFNSMDDFIINTTPIPERFKNNRDAREAKEEFLKHYYLSVYMASKDCSPNDANIEGGKRKQRIKSKKQRTRRRRTNKSRKSRRHRK
jgi:hypothetical protein